MKIIVLLTFLIGFNVQAVITKNCPEEVRVDLPHLSSLTFNSSNDRGMLALKRRIQRLGDLRLSFALYSADNAKCIYYGTNQEGNFAMAILSGSTRSQAKRPATLKFYALESLVGYISIKDVTLSGLLQKNNFSSLYYRGERCSYEDCIPDHILLGTGSTILN